MKGNITWIIIFGLVSGSALLLSLYQLWGWTGPIILLALVVSGTVAAVVYKQTYVRIGEMEFGVVFRHNGNFSRFLDSDGRYYLNPIAERLEERITRRPQKAHATTRNLRTREGVTVAIAWIVTFKVNVHNILPAIRSQLACSLPRSADKIVAGKTIQSLRHIIEQKSIRELYSVDAMKELECQLCDQVNARLELRHEEALSVNGVAPSPPREQDEPIRGLGFDPVPWRAVQIISIEMPPEVERTLRVAHERRLQTVTAANALARLQAVIHEFTDSDMERLAELERLRILDKNEQSLAHLMATLSGSGRLMPSQAAPGWRERQSN